jgi:lipopolysaccharide transport system permease protein
MVGVIDGFRWALLGSGELFVEGLSISAALSILLILVGIRYFRSTERTFADVI